MNEDPPHQLPAELRARVMIDEQLTDALAELDAGAAALELETNFAGEPTG